jgi:DnaA-homolog protein
MQLALPFPLAAHASFVTFVAANASPVLAQVRLAATGHSAPVWLWGGAGSGRTHLLQAACRAADEAGLRSMYLPLGHPDLDDPQLLRELEEIDFLALDDVHAVIGADDWERALFRVLESAQTGVPALLLAASLPPANAAWRLPDLGSRASAAVVFRLDQLNDDERLQALSLHAAHRGLELPDSAGRYLLDRIGRDMATLCGWLERLDRASLAAQRRLTVPFIRSLLVDQDGPVQNRSV